MYYTISGQKSGAVKDIDIADILAFFSINIDIVSISISAIVIIIIIITIIIGIFWT